MLNTKKFFFSTYFIYVFLIISPKKNNFCNGNSVRHIEDNTRYKYSELSLNIQHFSLNKNGVLIHTATLRRLKSL